MACPGAIRLSMTTVPPARMQAVGPATVNGRASRYRDARVNPAYHMVFPIEASWIRRVYSNLLGVPVVPDVNTMRIGSSGSFLGSEYSCGSGPSMMLWSHCGVVA